MTFDKGELPTREGQTVEALCGWLVDADVAICDGDANFAYNDPETMHGLAERLLAFLDRTVLPDPPKPWQAGDAVYFTTGRTGSLARGDDGRWSGGRYRANDLYLTDAHVDKEVAAGTAVPLVRAGEVVTQPQDGEQA